MTDEEFYEAIDQYLSDYEQSQNEPCIYLSREKYDEFMSVYFDS